MEYRLSSSDLEFSKMLEKFVFYHPLYHPHGLSGTENSTKWTDELFLQKYSTEIKDFLPKDRDSPSAITACKWLLGAYTGQVESQDWGSDKLMYNMVNAASTIGLGAGSYLYPPGNSDQAGNDITLANALDQYEYLDEQFQPTNEIRVRTRTQARYTYNIHSVNSWYQELKKGLESDDPLHQELAQAQVVFLFDTLLRLTQKDPKTVYNHYTEKINETFRGVFGRTTVTRAHPPIATAFEAFKTVFSPNSNLAKSKLKINMYAMYTAEKNKIKAKENIQWLDATSMLSLGGTGLGLIEWFFKVCNMICKTPSEVLDHFLLVGCFGESPERLLKWLQESKDQVTWRWCRIIDNAALLEYTLPNNKDMTIVCALIMVNFEVSKLKSYSSFSKYSAKIEPLVHVARKIQKELMGLAPLGH